LFKKAPKKGRSRVSGGKKKLKKKAEIAKGGGDGLRTKNSASQEGKEWAKT